MATPQLSSLSNLVHLAVIGTAGRGPDGSKLNSTLFDRMVSHVEHLQRDVWKLPNERVMLVSGGSAWADHVAVKLFINQATTPEGTPYAGLQLYLPCALTVSSVEASVTRAVDNGSWKWQVNPGRLLNQVHDAFSKAIGRNTFDEIMCAEKLGAKLCFEGRGFHGRNKLVAKRADRMVAFTWSDSNTHPTDGGTKHTWQLCKIAKERKVHVPLTSLLECQSQSSTPSLSPLSSIRTPPSLTGNEEIKSDDLESISRSKRKLNLQLTAATVVSNEESAEQGPSKKSKLER